MKTQFKIKSNKLAFIFVALIASMLLLSNVVLADSDHNHQMSDDSKQKQMPKMDGMSMDDMSMDDKSMKNMDHSKHEMNSGQMNMAMPMGGGMAMGKAQGGSAPDNARDPHANSGGYKLGLKRRLVLADEMMFASLFVDRLETISNDGNNSQVYDLQAWFGYDYDRLVFKAEGDISDQSLDEASTELLWGHAIATFWDTQIGLRYDSGEGENRTWAAFGVQGLAPYWFELDTTFYIGEDLRTAISIEAEYEILITQKLILQPRLESEIFGKSDANKGIGAGLANINIGLRLRYEFKREFATYVGYERATRFGKTADLAGGSSGENLWIAGLRFWI